MKSFRKSIFLCLLGTLTTFRADPSLAASLEFLGDWNLMTGTSFGETTVGGLSGITQDPMTGQYLVISDDRSLINPARFYTFDVAIDATGHPSLTPVSVTALLDLEGATFAPRSIDPEGIAVTSLGTVFVSSEGNGKLDPRIPPAVFILNKSGQVRGSLEIPAHYLPNLTGDLVTGVQNNEGFEGLSLSPDQSTLFVMTEGPLAQDDTDADLLKGSTNRGLIYKLQADGSYALQSEFAYGVETAKDYADGVVPVGGGNGISEVLALNDHQLIILERGGLELENDGWRSFERLYTVDVAEATDVSGATSLRGLPSLTLARKELLLDLDDLVPQFSPGYRTLDNLEGLAFGPKLPDGSRTLLILSDDNFSGSQRTQALFFKIVE